MNPFDFVILSFFDLTFTEHIPTLQINNHVIVLPLYTLNLLQYLKFLHTYFYAEIAVSPNNNVVNIYEKKGKDWVKIHELTEHSGRITGTSASISQ